MLHVNIATRPFYNERGVHLLLAFVALALVALTAFNVTELLRLSSREAELTARISKQESRARDLRQEAVKIRAGIRQEELEAVLIAAREANGLIDQRTFSWTELFNYLETTLPADVMLMAVRPVVHDGQVSVTLGVVGQRVDAIDQFMTRLEETGAFRDVLSRDEQARDDGGYEATLVGVYVPEAAARATHVEQPGDAQQATGQVP
jgi:hypothetical protein